MASWSHRLIQERAIEEVWQYKARRAPLLLLSFAHIDFLGVGQIGLELLRSNLLIPEILLCNLLIQMIWMILLPDCISCIFSFFFNWKYYRFRIQNAWRDWLWWFTCCSDKTEFVYLIDLVDVLSPVHFLDCCLVDLPLDARGVGFVLVVHEWSWALLLSTTCWSSAAFFLASDTTMFWMCQMISAIVGAITIFPQHRWLAIILLPPFLRLQVWAHQGIMLPDLSEPSRLCAWSTSAIHHVSYASSCCVEVAVLLWLATDSSWLQHAIACVILCAEILEIEIEILFLRLLA